MTYRTTVYQALKSFEPLLAIVGQISETKPNIHEASSLNEVPPRPFVTYRMHTGFHFQRLGKREYVQIWAHDDPGDYMRIDQILDCCWAALVNLPPDPSAKFVEANWIETGVDLRDDRMGTITRYIRFQLTGHLQ